MSGHRWARVLLLVLPLALAGCQVVPGRGQSSPSPGAQAVDRRVQAADARLYAGDYERAESEYRSLAAAGVPQATAHLSTLLAYENRFQEAVAQAQAAVQARPDSESLARLTRALDWSEEIDEALAVGARAVAARPAHPLAHVFYSEVLADAGRFAAAAKELRLAESAPGDAYVRAEIDREWANYYRSQQDAEAELNYTELAIKEQPGFPERQLDLVRYDYGNQRTDSARAAVDKLMSAHPKNYRLLVDGGDAALAGSDATYAQALYAAAAAVRPSGAEAALGQAEIDVAARRDFNAAHDVLLAALKLDPTSAGVYEYLRHLDLLVLKTSPDAELQPIVPQPPAGLAADRAAALARVNGYRSAVGLPAIAEDAGLAEAAQAHVYFYLFNLGQPQLQGLGIHTEDSGLPGFIGADPLARGRHFGFTGPRATEVVDHVFTPEASVEIWVDSVFHRFPILDRDSRWGGFGEVQIGALTLSVLDLGQGEPSAGDPVVFPAANQSGVPATFVGNEIPEPLPQGTPYPVGYPVTLQAGGAQKLTIATGRLLGPDGKEVPTYAVGPGDPGGAFAWALIPQQPLLPGATYTAEVTGTADGADVSRRWSFTVATP